MTRHLVLSAALLFAASACEDPADEAPAATVVEGAAPAEAPPAPAEGLVELAFSDETGSKIEWVGSKVSRSHEGAFGDFAGTIRLNPEDVTASEVEVTIQMASVNADEPDLTSHLKNDDFFDVERFPTATFRSTSIREGAEGEGADEATHTVTGALTLRDQTHTVSFPAVIRVQPGEVRAQTEFSIDRQRWGITYPGMPDDLIRDRVVIKLDARAPRDQS